MFIFLSSGDRRYPNNSPWDFTIYLSSRTCTNDGAWECALVELWTKGVEDLPEPLHVLCDFISDCSVLNGINTNLLRIVRTIGDVTIPYFMPIRPANGTQSIRLYIRTADGGTPSLVCEEVSCVLELRPIQ